MSILVAKDQLKTLTKGKFIKHMINHSWYIIDPNTKSHCVSDCLAILTLYRSNNPI